MILESHSMVIFYGKLVHTEYQNINLKYSYVKKNLKFFIFTHNSHTQHAILEEEKYNCYNIYCNKKL